MVIKIPEVIILSHTIIDITFSYFQKIEKYLYFKRNCPNDEEEGEEGEREKIVPLFTYILCHFVKIFFIIKYLFLFPPSLGCIDEVQVTTMAIMAL